MSDYPRDLIGYGRSGFDPQWPGDAYVAVQFVINYEEGGENCILHGDAASEAFLSEIVGAASWNIDPNQVGVMGFSAGGHLASTLGTQFDDAETGNFFMRVSFRSETGSDRTALEAAFAEVARSFDMTFAFHDETEKMKVVLMVSRFGHCLNDLLYRWRIGALPIDIVAVISNHMDYQKVVVNHDIPFHCSLQVFFVFLSINSIWFA